MQVIDNESFKEIIYNDLKDIISISSFLSDYKPEQINRRLLGRMFLEASKCEELLDAYGANQNTYWYPVRKTIAVMKSFSQVAYDLLHLSNALPYYRLLSNEDSFKNDTDKIIEQFFKAFIDNSRNFKKILKNLKMNGDLYQPDHYQFSEKQIECKLESDIVRKDTNTRETTIYLATAFLNLSEEGGILKIYKKTNRNDYCDCFPDILNEEKLRLLSDKFHNLQAIYDTYLSQSNIALKDENLPILRGQISVVYHLLDMATILTHYYERHCNKARDKFKQPLQETALLTMIMEYYIAYSDQHIVAAQNLCREILKNYAVKGHIEVPIPNYRGFHVRPSTLIAKIVIHYGSEVIMSLGKSEYNASMPLELFRANEELNLAKRNRVGEELSKHNLIKNDKQISPDPLLMKKKLRMIFLDFLERNKIVLYDNDFSFKDITPYENESLIEFVKRTITLYLALGKIDIVSDQTVKFTGDVRVLEDIRILAEHGYGEDKYGNNIVLPPELSYLRR